MCVRAEKKIRVGSRKKFPGEIRGTADPSASLEMTKERLTFLCKVVSEPKTFHHLGWAATTLYETVALSFVIPSEAEGSAVPRTFRGNVFDRARARDLRFLLWAVRATNL
jgi:hypothetical protein